MSGDNGSQLRRESGADPGVDERLARLDSCAVSDALDELGLHGVVPGLHPLSRPSRVLCGRVVTVKVVLRRDSKPAPHLGTQAIMAARPGDVIVVDNEERLEVSGWGGLLSLAASRRGVAGVIVNGACRDIDEAVDLGFAVFARAAIPLTARRRVVEESFNEPVTIGEITVRPGDHVIADGTGVVFIPADRSSAVLDMAERITIREEAMAAACRAGRSIVEIMHDDQFALPNTGGDRD